MSNLVPQADVAGGFPGSVRRQYYAAGDVNLTSTNSATGKYYWQELNGARIIINNSVARTVTLPLASSSAGLEFEIVAYSATADITVTTSPAGWFQTDYGSEIASATGVVMAATPTVGQYEAAEGASLSFFSLHATDNWNASSSAARHPAPGAANRGWITKYSAGGGRLVLGEIQVSAATADLAVILGNTAATSEFEVRDSAGAAVFEARADGSCVVAGTTGGLTVTAGGLTVTAGGETITAGGLKINSVAVVADVTGGSPVTVSDARSGSWYVADTTGGNITYNLPATASMVGRTFRFIKGAAGNNMIITAGGAHIYGAVHENDVDTEGAPSTTGTFTAGAIGDYLEVIGIHATMIFARGQSAGATFAWS